GTRLGGGCAIAASKRMGDVERDRQPLARLERNRAVPHGRREEDEPARLRLDQAGWWEVDAERALRAPEREPAGMIRPARAFGKDDVEGRAEPAFRMDMVGMIALAG